MGKTYRAALKLAAFVMLVGIIVSSQAKNKFFFNKWYDADSTKKDSVVYEKFKDLPLKPQRKIKLNSNEGKEIER